MTTKAALTLTTGLEDPEQVTVALLTAVAAAEEGRPTKVFLAPVPLWQWIGDEGAITFSF